jgi:hypothetical protein
VPMTRGHGKPAPLLTMLSCSNHSSLCLMRRQSNGVQLRRQTRRSGFSNVRVLSFCYQRLTYMAVIVYIPFRIWLTDSGAQDVRESTQILAARALLTQTMATVIVDATRRWLSTPAVCGRRDHHPPWLHPGRVSHLQKGPLPSNLQSY